MDADIHSYLDSWSEELSARSNRVRQLIGSAHWLSDGHHKEEILREFVLRYLPNGLSVTRGFVKTTRDLSKCSPEADILVTDPSLNPPFFSEGGLQIVDGSALIAQFEVKTTFSNATLADALQNIHRVQSIARTCSTREVWSSVCFYTGTSDMDADQLFHVLQKGITALAANFISTPTDVLMLPTCIVTLDNYCIFIEPVTEQRAARCKLIKTGRLSFPCAFADLFAAVRRGSGGPVVGGLDSVIEALPFGPSDIRVLSW